MPTKSSRRRQRTGVRIKRGDEAWRLRRRAYFTVEMMSHIVRRAVVSVDGLRSCLDEVGTIEELHEAVDLFIRRASVGWSQEWVNRALEDEAYWLPQGPGGRWRRRQQRRRRKAATRPTATP